MYVNKTNDISAFRADYTNVCNISIHVIYILFKYSHRKFVQMKENFQNLFVHQIMVCKHNLYIFHIKD